MITKEQFGLWKHEPVTKWFLDILVAKRDRMKAAAMDMWLDGASDFDTVGQVVRGQIIQLDEILTVGYDELQGFFEAEYGTKPESDRGKGK